MDFLFWEANKKMSEKLRRCVPTIKLIGGTGTGKTEIAIAFAEPRAQEILKRCVGTTNSTLCEKLFVYTDDEKKKDELIVAVEKKRDLLERGKFVETLVNALARVVIEDGKTQSAVRDEIKQKIEQYLIEEINETSNKKTVYGFLKETKKHEIAEKIAEICTRDTYKYFRCFFEIYHTTKNSMTEMEVKGSSKKFLYAIKMNVEKSLDLMEQSFKKEIWERWDEINNELNSIFLQYFEEDGNNLYVKKINLNEQNDIDKSFVECMFTSNSLWNGEKLSLEIFCEKIYIHVPCRKDICTNKKATQEFRHTLKKNMEFGILDTCGLKNSASKEMYLNEMVYQGEADALVFVMPMMGDTNAEELYELYCDILSRYKKRIPIYILCNKVDLYLEDRMGEKLVEIDEEFIEKEGRKEEIEWQIEQEIKNRRDKLKEQLKNIQNKARKDEEIEVYLCALGRGFKGSRVEKLISDYDIDNVLISIIEKVNSRLENEKVDQKICVSKDIDVKINRVRLKKEIHNHIHEIAIDKKVFVPGVININSNLGVIPDKENYKLFRERLKYGDGYNANMCEAYYYKCGSFSVDFPANLRNFCSNVYEIVQNVVEVKGRNIFLGYDDYEKFIKKISDNIEAKKFVRILLYDDALYEAEKNNFSDAKKFYVFLRNSKSYFTKEEIEEEKFVDAMESVITEAIWKISERDCEVRINFVEEDYRNRRENDCEERINFVEVMENGDNEWVEKWLEERRKGGSIFRKN